MKLKKIFGIIFLSTFLFSCSNENIFKLKNSEKEFEVEIEIIKNQKILIDWKATWKWFFEWDFPVTLTDEDWKILVEKYVTAKWNRMTTKYVDFTWVINYQNPETKYWYLIFENSNPSGLKKFEIKEKIKIKLK